MVRIIFLIGFLCLHCVSKQRVHASYRLEGAADPFKVSDAKFSKKYGYNSECLVLMEGPVPSRMEPCVIGDIRSASMMYKETEVTVIGDTAQFEWQMTGVVYSPFVNETYYQNEILYRGSFFRRLSFRDGQYPKMRYHPSFLGGPYLVSPYYRSYYGGYYRFGRQ
ncbi:hypothetical protein [Leptospira jelokensis]|uniref:Uncharacterized protein n=1 Tax=Leptospira jelokensis TaxID=2484931 RepID=A0A4Z1A1B6_9LEPT|nr:hypothetical protein [Leptospira jelokensis]TGL72136.1 hypothetical protein EHQ62_04670 [Leptospira jelokensis]